MAERVHAKSPDKGEMAEMLEGKKAQEVYQAIQKESSGFLPQVIFKKIKGQEGIF